MNTIKCFALALVLFASSLFSACNQESAGELTGGPAKPQLIDPANSVNPYDYIGARHNEGLTFLRARYQSEFEQLNASRPEAAEVYIFDRSAEFGKSNPELYVALRRKLSLRDGELLRDVRFDNYAELFKRIGLSEEGRQALESVMAEVMKTEPGTVEATNAIIATIKRYETQLVAKENLADREFVLTLLAVWRYSLYYWTNYFVVDGNPGGPTTRAKWWQIGLADAACGAIGFVLGGPGAGVSLGLGASKLVADKT